MGVDITLILIIFGGLLALFPGWLLFQKAYFTSRWRFLTVLCGLLLTALLAAGAFWFPFYLDAGKQVARYETLIDLLLYGVSSLVLVALLAYIVDFLWETPGRALLGASACFAITALPVLYYVYAPEMHQRFEIEIVEQDGTGEGSAPEDSGEFAPYSPQALFKVQAWHLI